MSGTIASAQAPSASSLRSTPNEIEREDTRVTQIIQRAEDYFTKAKLNLKDSRLAQARDDFDKSVDTVLESGMDVRGNPRLRDYYLQLVERIYREEVPTAAGGAQNVLVKNATPAGSAGDAMSTNINLAGLGAASLMVSAQTGQVAQDTQTVAPQIGFREQKFEPSPLDDLSRLELTKEEQNVTTEEVAELEEVVKSTVDFGFRPNPLVQQFINYYQGRGRATMDTGLRRSGRYMKMVRRIFREEGVPEDIAWLGQVESAWRPTAQSWAAASGLWQFIPGTGARFGLRQTAWIDERNSFEKATRASARYLKWLNQRYNGNWELAMGAYNTGEGNVDRAIRRAGTADFWSIYPYIAKETRNYVPNILATILIAKNPERYGFRNIRPEAPLSYDVVRVPTATHLQLVAQATGSSVDFLRSINPELRRDVTPYGESYDLRVPANRAMEFVAFLKNVPVAQRAGRSLNLTSYTRPRPAGATSAPAAGRRLTTVRANTGDTIAVIAARAGAMADEVAKINGIAADTQLQAGQQIMVPTPGDAAPLSGRPARRR